MLLKRKLASLTIAVALLLPSLAVPASAADYPEPGYTFTPGTIYSSTEAQEIMLRSIGFTYNSSGSIKVATTWNSNGRIVRSYPTQRCTCGYVFAEAWQYRLPQASETSVTAYSTAARDYTYQSGRWEQTADIAYCTVKPNSDLFSWSTTIVGRNSDTYEIDSVPSVQYERETCPVASCGVTKSVAGWCMGRCSDTYYYSITYYPSQFNIGSKGYSANAPVVIQGAQEVHAI